MKRILRENGLSIILILLFLLTWVGQFFTGLLSYNRERVMHHFPPVSALPYLLSGHFIEATFENWESEFLQMAVFVLLTACAYQRGSAESNPLPEETTKEETAGEKNPLPRYFRNHSFLRKIYENSLSLALLILFLGSFVGHVYGGWKEENLQHLMTQDPQGQVSFLEFLSSAEFWFQSFQNWQSEFLSVGVIVILSIFLRQKGSSQSKKLDSPHWKTKD